MKPLQRARITDCPHGGRHNGQTGYVVDSYPDGTSSVDMGRNTCCITAGWEPIEPVRREDLQLNDDGLVEEVVDCVPETPPQKRRGRPPKNQDEIVQPKRKRAVTESRAQAETSVSPVLQVTSIKGGRVSLTYSNGESRASADNVTLEDLRMICAIVKTLSSKGGQ